MRRQPAITVALLAVTAFTRAALAAAPLIANGPPLTDAQEAANRDTVAALRAGAQRGDQPAIRSRLATDLRNHDQREPSGAAGYAAYLASPAAADPDTALLALPPTTVITDGALTLVASGPGAESGSFASTLVEVKDGRIMQRWYSGPIPGVPAAAASSVLASVDDDRSRAADSALVMDFFASFFGQGNAGAAARDLSPTLQSHVPGVPSGPGFALVARKHQGKVTASDVGTPLFLLAQGDLVAIGFPIPQAGDPGAGYALNILRVRAGHIVDWWFSGTPALQPVVRWAMGPQRSPTTRLPPR